MVAPTTPGVPAGDSDQPMQVERNYEKVLARAWARAVVRARDGRPAPEGVLAGAIVVDVDVPVDSSSWSRTASKRALRSAQRWYLRYIVDQVNRMGSALSGSIAVVQDRLRQLEDAVGIQDDLVAEEVLASTEVPLPEAVCRACVSTLVGAVGRVVHVEAGDGDVVSELVSRGVDAYGVDPGLSIAPGRSDLEIWRTDALEHLRALEPETLAGAVLSGITDRAAPGRVLEVLEAVWQALEPGARLAVVAADPRWWSRLQGSVRADLAPGRPLQPGTWSHLLLERGAIDVVVESFADERAGVPPVPGDDERTAAINARLAALSHELFSPTHHLVTARRPSPGGSPGEG